MAAKFFVTGGTGHQGGATARHLLDLNLAVHLLVRNPLSEAAIALQKRGAVLFKGDFDDVEAINAACAGIRGVFLNVYPTWENWDIEFRHAQNVIRAVEHAGVDTIIYSSMMLIAQRELFPGWPDYPHAEFYLNKHRIEEAVRRSTIPHFTILRPAFLMQNFLKPICPIFYPELAAPTYTLHTACLPTTPFFLLDADDVGAFSAAIFKDPIRFHAEEIELGHQLLEPREIAQSISKHTALNIKVRYFSEPEARDLINERAVVGHERLMNEMSHHLHPTPDSFGIRMTDFDTFLKQHRLEILDVLRPLP